METTSVHHPLYTTYRSMRQRCEQVNAPVYKDYGARGITVCDRWKGSKRGEGFANFVADMGAKPSPKHTLDRIDNDKGYSPENCRWATRLQQSMNNSRTKRFVRDGVEYKCFEVAMEYGIEPQVIIYRAKVGMSFSEITSRHHLEPGYSHMSHIQRIGSETYTQKTHCKRGHPFSGDNLRIYKGNRVCIQCARANERKSRGKRRLAKNHHSLTL